jgi:hypothetical protein
MKAHHYDIVRKDTESSTWLEDAKDLPSAECRARELASYWPGEFQILDHRSHRVVATISGETDAKAIDAPAKMSGRNPSVWAA